MFYSEVAPYIQAKKVNTKQGPDDLWLATYSKSCFFNHDWDNVTKACRGLVFQDCGHDYVSVNHPIPKIFNMNEEPETAEKVIRERMENEPYEILEKSNGHLCMVFYARGNWQVITKGSWDSEMVEKDRELLERMGVFNRLGDNFPYYSGFTFHFEIIAEHDQHTLYPLYKEKYGRDTAVLLAMRGPMSDYAHNVLEVTAKHLGTEVVEKFDFSDRDILDWYKDTDCEGYVIHFLKDHFRVKVKCDEYLKMRYRKEFFSEQKFLKIFVLHGSSPEAFDLIPEELHCAYRQLLHDFACFVQSEITHQMVPEYIAGFKGSDPSVVYTEVGKSGFPKNMKSYIFQVLRGHTHIDLWKLFKKDFAASYDCDSIQFNAVDMFN